MATELPEEPKSRKEQYLADIAGQDVELPAEPKSREEQYLAYIAENGGGGGGGGTSNFNQLSNRPKYKGTAMTGDTNIPEVKTYTAGTGLNLNGTSFSVDYTDTQAKLTAGSNISITDNTISATDTTYSDFTGTDGTAAGAAGLVPAPATTDAGKFLKADGTWGTAGGGASYTAGDGIDITNDVISATNTGKAKVLTTADYNYHGSGDTDDGVALWLLSPGLYTWASGTAVYSSNTAVYVNEAGAALIRPEVSGVVPLYFCRGSGDTYFERITKNSGARSGNVETILTNEFVINNLSSTATNLPLSANQGKVLKDLIDGLAISGAGAPTTSTVGTVGKLYEDTTNGKLYICTAIVPGTDPDPDTYTWSEVGAGGSGPTVVQTTGTSTTDVMSQNAVTSMVFADPSINKRVQIGNNNSVSGMNNDGYVIAGNNNTLKNQYGGVLLGDYSNVGTNNNSAYAVAIGSHTKATGNQSVALGLYPTASGTNSIAIGGSDTTLTVASAYNSIALGGAQATVQGQFDVSTGTNTTGGYNSTNYRLLTGLYDPQSAHDAATKGYVDPTTDSSAPTTATVGRLGQIQIDTTNADAYMCVAVDDVTPSYTWKKINA